jgi:hypothetical protein
MQYNFSAEFLLIRDPDSTFAQAWESLCATLIREEFGPDGVLRLSAPDTGIDILHRPSRDAYQCKSNVTGTHGTIAASSSLRSLNAAYPHRHRLDWDAYVFATNAPFSGVALAKILDAASQLGLAQDAIIFRGPEYWDSLCAAHSSAVEDRFDYKVSLSEKQLLDALEAYLSEIGQSHFIGENVEDTLSSAEPFEIRNNLTKLIVKVLVSPKMRAEQLVAALLHAFDLTDLMHRSDDRLTFLPTEAQFAADGKLVSPSTEIGQLIDRGCVDLSLRLTSASEKLSEMQQRIWDAGLFLTQSSLEAHRLKRAA